MRRRAKSLLQQKCLIPSGFVDRNGTRTRAEAISRDSLTAFVLAGSGVVGVRVGAGEYTAHCALSDYACPECDQ